MSEINDLTGQRFGKLTVIKENGRTKVGRVKWLCRFDCGEEITTSCQHVREYGYACEGRSCFSCNRKNKGLAGQIFGNWTILEYVGTDGHQSKYYNCKCICGNEKKVRLAHLKSGKSVSCGCLNKNDISGKKFGKLYVVEKSKTDEHGNVYYKCKCDCGIEKDVSYRLLTRENGVKSCGCMKKENTELNKHRSGVNEKYAHYRHAAKKMGREFKLDVKQFEKLIMSECFYCGESPSNENKYIKYNGIDRVNPEEGYTIENTVSSCRQCNFSKKEYTQSEFYSWVKRIYKNLEEKKLLN